MISHEHRCLFVHIPKCGGSSIEQVFVKLAGLNWKTRAPLLLGPNRQAERGPPRLAHLTAEQYVSCNHLPQSTFDEYFKFTFVRNPWARAVSIYYSTAYNLYPDFKSYVVDRFSRNSKHTSNWFSQPQSSFFLDQDGWPLVDFIGRLESINDDFLRVAQHLQLGEIHLPHRNKTKREGYREVIENDSTDYAYKAFYDEETREIVSDYYREDIYLLDYRFDEDENS